MCSINNPETESSTSRSLVCSIRETTILFVARSYLVFPELHVNYQVEGKSGQLTLSLPFNLFFIKPSNILVVHHCYVEDCNFSYETVYM